MSAMKIPRADEIVAILRARVGGARLRDCVSVAERMWSIAPATGVDPEKAAIAGFLHDMCKSMPQEEMLAAAESYGIPINEVQRKRPTLLHGLVAAEEARHQLGIHDDAVHEAIAWHVTGKPDIGPLALSLYYADFSEPLRTHEEAAQARTIFDTAGLLRAVRFVANAKVAILNHKNALVDPNAHQFSAWLEKQEE